MPLHVQNVLMPLTTIYHVRKDSLYIPFSVKTSTTLVNHIFHNLLHVEFPICVCF